MKKIQTFCCYLLIFISVLGCFNLSTITVKASETKNLLTIEYLGNGHYAETFIEETDFEIAPVESRSTMQYITRTKTTQIKNSSGTVLWSVSITATFGYDGTTAVCTSCTPGAHAYASSWEIILMTGSKSENSATARAVAERTYLFGQTEKFTETVTIKCTPYGVVS